MSQQLRHYNKPSQRPSTTAHLTQTMSLLELNNQELLEKIEGELSNNPALEIKETFRCPTCNSKLEGKTLCPKCTYKSNENLDDPIVFVSSNNQEYSKPYTGNDRPQDEYSKQIEDLPTYILSQISSELEPNQREIAAHILTSLDKDGFLQEELFNISRFLHVSIDEIEEVLLLIKKSDPLGVGSTSPKEALLIQLDVLSETTNIPQGIKHIIEQGYELLIKKQIKALNKKFQLSIPQIENIISYVSENLNPFPGRSFWGTVRHQSGEGPARFHKPDILISKSLYESDQLIVEVLWPLRGFLKVNSIFQKALAEAPSNKEEKWKAYLEKATLLVKCLHQRNHTMVRLMQEIAKIQNNFILKGDAHLVPCTRASLAIKLGVHESTISRAVSGKSAQLPSGKIIPLSKFFDRSLHIRTALKKIIIREEKPLSDIKIANLLEKQGYNIARRTVAKYRSMEGILPAHQRG